MRRSFFLFAVVIASFGAGCAEDCTTVEPEYAGETTDEVWSVLVGARAEATKAADSATITAPAANAVVDAATPLTVTWDSPLRVAANTPRLPRLPRFPGAHTPRSSTWMQTLTNLVLPTAHAHLAPITSDVYLVEVDVPGRTCPFSVLTTELSATFSDEAWASIVDGDSGARTVRLMSAFVTENRITEGPFTASSVAFTAQ
jgi:hypothetical protein